MTFITTASYYVPCVNRTHNYSLGALVSGVNSSQGTFIIVKESLVFSNFPVILCQDKLIEIILCKTLRVSKLLDFILFLLDYDYYIVYKVGCRWFFDYE